jgi:hypothetical protein
VLRIVESWDGWLAAAWEGRGGMRKKNKEKQRKRVSAEGVYIMVFTDGITEQIHFIGDFVSDSVGDSVMSLYGYLSLNLSIIPSVKSSEKIVCRRYGRYIPTDFEMEFSPPTKYFYW